MTRGELIKAIFDSLVNWSCPRAHDCDDTDLDECMKCAERQLEEYENSIRAEERRKFAEWLTKSDYANGYFDTENGYVSVDKVLAKYEKQMKEGD